MAQVAQRVIRRRRLWRSGCVAHARVLTNVAQQVIVAHAGADQCGAVAPLWRMQVQW